MNRILPCIGALALSVFPSFGATTGYVFIDSRAASPNTLTWGGHTYDVSPYGGAIGPDGVHEANDTPVKLFCDDFADSASYNSSWSANITGVNDVDQSKTRFGSAVGTTGIYPTGKTLYQQVAWLFTQTLAQGVNQDNQDTIQEAVWKLTGASNSTPNVTYSDANPISGSPNSWISLAAANYDKVVTGYLTPDYNKWVIVTQIGAEGYVTGHGTQEFLAYYNTPNGNPVTAATPEPATFALAGAALIALGLRRRKRRS